MRFIKNICYRMLLTFIFIDKVFSSTSGPTMSFAGVFDEGIYDQTPLRIAHHAGGIRR